jgi:hypothetical protein
VKWKGIKLNQGRFRLASFLTRGKPLPGPLKNTNNGLSFVSLAVSLLPPQTGGQHGSFSFGSHQGVHHVNKNERFWPTTWNFLTLFAVVLIVFRRPIEVV